MTDATSRETGELLMYRELRESFARAHDRETAAYAEFAGATGVTPTSMEAGPAPEPPSLETLRARGQEPDYEEYAAATLPFWARHGR